MTAMRGSLKNLIIRISCYVVHTLVCDGKGNEGHGTEN
jgi:hypothetical protein